MKIHTRKTPKDASRLLAQKLKETAVTSAKIAAFKAAIKDKTYHHAALDFAESNKVFVPLPKSCPCFDADLDFSSKVTTTRLRLSPVKIALTAIEAAKPCASTAVNRPMINGVRLDKKAQAAIATNGHILVHLACVTTLDATVKLSSIPKASYTQSDFIDGDFPNWRVVVPGGYNTRPYLTYSLEQLRKYGVIGAHYNKAFANATRSTTACVLALPFKEVAYFNPIYIKILAEVLLSRGHTQVCLRGGAELALLAQTLPDKDFVVLMPLRRYDETKQLIIPVPQI